MISFSVFQQPHSSSSCCSNTKMIIISWLRLSVVAFVLRIWNAHSQCFFRLRWRILPIWEFLGGCYNSSFRHDASSLRRCRGCTWRNWGSIFVLGCIAMVDSSGKGQEFYTRLTMTVLRRCVLSAAASIRLGQGEAHRSVSSLTRRRARAAAAACPKTSASPYVSSDPDIFESQVAVFATTSPRSGARARGGRKGPWRERKHKRRLCADGPSSELKQPGKGSRGLF